MLKAARILAATAVVWTMTVFMEVAAIAAETAPSCGGFGGGSSGGGSSGDASAVAGAEGGGMMGFIFPLAIFVLIFYFFIIRPQRKRQKQQDDLVTSISKGDQVVTIGGFFGIIQEVREDSFVIELAKDVRVRILKTAVSTKRAPAQTHAQIENK